MTTRSPSAQPRYSKSPIPGVRTFESGVPGPRIGIVGGVHGNEPCGVRALAMLEKRFEAGTLSLTRGSLTLVDANLEALLQKVRHTKGGEDLNRLWAFEFEQRLNPSVWGYEHHRALALRECLKSMDAVLDLHSASEVTPPFAICNGIEGALTIACSLGAPFIVRSWAGLAHKVMVGYLATLGIPGMAVECGEHSAPESVDVAVNVATRFLENRGLIEGPVTTTPEAAVTVVDVVETIAKPSLHFVFEQPFRGFQRLKKGMILGRDQISEVRVHRSCFAVLPHPNAAPGKDMLYLAVQAEQAEQAEQAGL